MWKTRASPTLAIEVRGLRKSYGKTEAVRGVDLRVSKGEVLALLGPNGAGKTTIVEILEGHRDRTAGEVSVLGYDPGRGEGALKQRIGIVLQSTGVEPYLSVEETIDLFRAYFPHPQLLDKDDSLVKTRFEEVPAISHICALPYVGVVYGTETVYCTQVWVRLF